MHKSSSKKAPKSSTNKLNDIVLTKSLERNISLFKDIFSDDDTLIVRRFQNKYLPAAKCCLIYFEGMIDTKMVNESVIEPILGNNLAEDICTKNLLEELQYKVIASNNVFIFADINKIVSLLINGNSILLVEGYDKCLIVQSKGWQTRAISEPESARVVRGPREGFTEAIVTNISLIRRRIKDPDLKLKFLEIGERTRTKTCICYIEGLAQESILNELEKRLNEIKIDAILDSGYIQELIKDEPFSPFETVGASERPDVIASKILEGRIALIVDGSPFVLTVPFIVAEAAQANEDYYNNYFFGTFNRMIRSFGVLFSISIPAIFLSLTTYHQEMLPTPLLLSISASRQDVPFPTGVSLFIMLIIFDILREAGTRMPSPAGEAINIVGTLVLGQAAVEAKLVSAPVVIVTAITGILTLLNKNLVGSTIIIRFLLLFLSALFGVYGIIFGFIVLIIHLMSIRSFGVPYMMNITTFKDHNAQDAWIRAPWWTMTLRPKIIGIKNLVRQSSNKQGRK